MAVTGRRACLPRPIGAGACYFPFIDRDEGKRRPALIVSLDTLFQDAALYWAVMITTASSGVRAYDVAVENIKEAGLPVPSFIRVPKLFALSEHQIGRRLGAISTANRNAVARLLKRFVG